MTLPTRQILSGVKILELGQLIAGPFASKTLADFGAEVIKVESPGEGDPLRKWRMLHKGTSVWWQAHSRNKQSICLDLRVKEGQEIARQLALEADVVIENFRPGTMEKWGLGWETLHKANPKLIMLRISGYGQDGPRRDEPGFAAIGEAMAGLRYITGHPGEVPVRAGISLGDTIAGLHGALGVLLALYERDARGGEGQMSRVLRVGAQIGSVNAQGIDTARTRHITIQRLASGLQQGPQIGTHYRKFDAIIIDGLQQQSEQGNDAAEHPWPASWLRREFVQ